ncbi:hypothetical protein GBAR_LOCUS29122, partial [Geodia barretti]
GERARARKRGTRSPQGKSHRYAPGTPTSTSTITNSDSDRAANPPSDPLHRQHIWAHHPGHLSHGWPRLRQPKRLWDS